MKAHRTFPEMMLLVAIAAIACMLFNIPDQAGDRIPVTIYILLFAYGIICYSLNRLFLKKPKSLTAAVLFNMFLIFAGFAAAFLLGQVTGIISGVFLGGFFVIMSIAAIKGITVGININVLTVCFDALVVLLLI